MSVKNDVDTNSTEQHSSHIKVGETVELLDLNKATLDEVRDFIVDTTIYGKFVNPEIQHPEFFDEEKRTLTHLEFGGSETRGVMLLKKNHCLIKVVSGELTLASHLDVERSYGIELETEEEAVSQQEPYYPPRDYFTGFFLFIAVMVVIFGLIFMGVN